MMSDERLKITVVVIARNEEANLPACLESLALQDFPADSHSVLIVDNASSDGTRRVADAFAAEHPRFQVLENPVRGIAPSRNFGLHNAGYPFVAFTDADCQADSGWLAALDKAFREERARDDSVAGVGGINRAPAGSTLFRRAVDAAVANYWGNHGSIQGLTPGKRCDVDHLPTLNALFDKERVLQEGGFDERMGNISEDVELSARLRWRGWRLVCEPAAVVYHTWRDDAWSWARNMEVYGKGRIWLMKKDLRFLKPHHLAPLGLLACTLGAGLFPPLWLPVFFYLALTAAFSLQAAFVKGRPHYAPLIFLIYLLTHYSYGIGQVHGIFARRGGDIEG